MTAKFTGVVGGVTYTDRAAFEKAARDAGHRGTDMNRTGDLRVGLPVSIRFDDDTIVSGQVWAKGPEPRCGYVWIALDNGRYARLYTGRLGWRAEEIAADGRALRVGKVAA